jgi:tetratricopeptide (TPR) repeat protein
MRAALFLGFFLWAEVSWAQSGASMKEAAALYQRADTSYKLQKYQESLKDFQASYELSKEPAILFNIGQCYRQLDQLSDAKKSFQFFLRDAPEHPKNSTAEKLIQELDEEIAKQSTKGKIQVSSAQDPAEVFINDVYQGRSPLTLSNLDPKKYNITVKKVGYVNYEVKTSVKPSQTIDINVPKMIPMGDATIVWPAKKFTRSSAALGGMGAASLGAAVLFSSLAVSAQNDGELDDKVAEQETLRSFTLTANVFVIASVVSSAGAASALGLGFIRRDK